MVLCLPPINVFLSTTPSKSTICLSPPLNSPLSPITLAPNNGNLGLNLDPKHYWHPHIAHMKLELRIQTFVLTTLTYSTWGAPFFSWCLLYTPLSVLPWTTHFLHGTNLWEPHRLKNTTSKTFCPCKTTASGPSLGPTGQHPSKTWRLRLESHHLWWT
jgi:hypothetical protein